jgi:flagellar motor switch protein FliG
MAAPDQRIRQVAIVLQSLDSGTSRGLLAQLPPEMARAVRQAMVNLGPVTPKERAQAMSGLQGLLGTLGRTQPKTAATSSFDEDSPAAELIANTTPLDQIDISSTSQEDDLQQPFVGHKNTLDSETPWLAWEPASLATFLADERPRVIATVLNQLSPERAKTLLDHLPITTASATLAAIPDLFLTDPQILSDILAEIERKLPKTPPVQKTATIAGLSKLTAIMDQFGESQKQAWLDSIALQNESVAKQLGWKPAVQLREEIKPVESIENPSSPPAIVEPAAVEVSSPAKSTITSVASAGSIASDIFDENRIVPISRYRDVPSLEKSNSELKGTTNDSIDHRVVSSHESTTVPARASEFDVLLELSDTDLVTLLHSCDKSAILTALCGASNRMIQRIEQLIPRNEVKRFRLHLRQRGSTSTHASELAQSAILLRAEELVITSRISALSSVTFVSAA